LEVGPAPRARRLAGLGVARGEAQTQLATAAVRTLLVPGASLTSRAASDRSEREHDVRHAVLVELEALAVDPPARDQAVIDDVLERDVERARDRTAMG